MKTRLFAVVLLVVCLVMCVVPAYAGSSITYCPNCGNQLNTSGERTKTAWPGCYGVRSDTPDFVKCPILSNCLFDYVSYYTDIKCQRCGYYSAAYSTHLHQIEHTVCSDINKCVYEGKSGKIYALYY